MVVACAKQASWGAHVTGVFCVMTTVVRYDGRAHGTAMRERAARSLWRGVGVGRVRCARARREKTVVSDATRTGTVATDATCEIQRRVVDEQNTSLGVQAKAQVHGIAPPPVPALTLKTYLLGPGGCGTTGHAHRDPERAREGSALSGSIVQHVARFTRKEPAFASGVIDRCMPLSSLATNERRVG